jgi:hypothetical protein
MQSVLFRELLNLEKINYNNLQNVSKFSVEMQFQFINLIEEDKRIKFLLLNNNPLKCYLKSNSNSIFSIQLEL